MFDQTAESTSLPAVLVIDDDRPMAELFTRILTGAGYDVATTTTIGQARDRIREKFFPIILCDINLGQGNGLELMSFSKDEKRKQLFVFITGEASVGTAMTAIRGGAFAYLSKPEDLDQLEKELVSTIARAARELNVDESHTAKLKASVAPGKRIIGKSPGMVAVYRALANAAMYRGHVLILGETGTGKEQIARAIHTNSEWAAYPFVTVNCSALTDTLLESELFGHIKGAFTGAVCNKRGLFEVASEGTIFLDEIGDISPALQVKLLRTIQEGEFKPVGSTETKRVNVRVIAATHRNLELAVKENRFREDLYFRLKVFLIELPPLRDRIEDLRELVNYFIAEASAKANKPIIGLADGVIDELKKYSWPGNIRELENAVTRAVVSAHSQTLFVEDFPREIFEDANDNPANPLAVAALPGGPQTGKPPTLAELERSYILKTLHDVGFKKAKAAEILGIDRVTLYRKVSRYGIGATQQPHQESETVSEV